MFCCNKKGKKIKKKYLFVLLYCFFLIPNEVLSQNMSPKDTLSLGINYYDGVVRYLKDNDDMFQNDFKQLHYYHIPYLRINGSGMFYSKDWQLYFRNKKEYFVRLDKVIRSAEQNNLKLIFTFFWRYDAIPKFFGEPINAYGRKNSKTNHFIKEYTKNIVTRYANSPAILGWEFGNEYNLKFNIPFKHLKKFFPKKESWHKDNLLKLKDFNVAMKIFASTIKTYDKKHFISTGHSVPRTYIYEKVNRKNYKSLLKEILLKENSYSDVISIHLYPWTLEKRKFYKYFDYDIAKFLQFLQLFSKSIDKKLLIGEFGFCKIKDVDEREKITLNYLNSIRENTVPFALLWVYNRKYDQSCNVKAEELDLLQQYNLQENLMIKHQNTLNTKSHKLCDCNFTKSAMYYLLF